MKKFLYILIIISGVFISATSLQAQTLGTCEIPGQPDEHVSAQECSNMGSQNWTPDGIYLQPNTTSNSSSSTSEGLYEFLAPIDTNAGGTGSTFDPRGDYALSNYLNMMLKLVIGLSAVMAVLMFVIGGIEYMTSELGSSKEAAKSRMSGAVVGLLVALGAYALLNTINPDLLKTEIAIENATLEIDLGDTVPQSAVNGRYSNGIAIGTPLTGATASLPPYVTLNATECTRVGQPNCTSTIGLNTDQVRQIQWGCGCELVITGGTEWWLHGGRTGSTTHQSGSSTVDLRTNTALDRYLSGGRPLVRMQRYPDANGPYLYEGNHWHIGR